jgi:hypothetical protein
MDAPSISGARCSLSLRELMRRCERLVLDEQRKITPDNTLIDTLCEAVRMCREYASLMGGHHHADRLGT